MYGYNLRTIEEYRRINMLAWQTNQAGAEKKQGKKIVPYFKSFDEFDNTKKSLEQLKAGYGNTQLRNKLKNQKELIKLLRQANS